MSVGVNGIGSTVDIENPDTNIGGVIKGNSQYGSRSFLKLGGNEGRSGTGSSQVIACGGVSGWVGICGGMAAATDAVGGKYSLATLVFNNAETTSYEMLNIISDLSGWKFSDTCKIALVMNGTGTQKISSEIIRFSGGVTAKKGTIILNSTATDANNTAFRHGDLSMEGGTFALADIKGINGGYFHVYRRLLGRRNYQAWSL